MLINTEDAKKIAGAYLSAVPDWRDLREYRLDVVRAILFRFGVEKVKDLTDDEAPHFVRALLDQWEKK